MSEPETWSMPPSDYVIDSDDGDTFTLMVGDSTVDLNPGDGLVLLDSAQNEMDGGTIEHIKEGFSGPLGVAPTSSTVTVRRWDSFKFDRDQEGGS